MIITNRVIFQSKLDILAAIIEAETVARLKTQGLDCPANISHARTLAPGSSQGASITSSIKVALAAS